MPKDDDEALLKPFKTKPFLNGILRKSKQFVNFKDVYDQTMKDLHSSDFDFLEELCSFIHNLLLQQPNPQQVPTFLEYIPFLIYSLLYVQRDFKKKLKKRRPSVSNIMSDEQHNFDRHVVPLHCLLLSIYNIFVVSNIAIQRDSPKVITDQINRLLSTPSVFHAPQRLTMCSVNLPELSTTTTTTNSAMGNQSVSYRLVEGINYDNFWTVMSGCIDYYIHNMLSVSSASIHSFCSLCTLLVKEGGGGESGMEFSRVVCNEDFLLHVLSGFYIVLFHSTMRDNDELLHLLQQMNRRATYEAWYRLLLYVDAIWNSLRRNPSGAPHEGPVGLRENIFKDMRDGAMTNADFILPKTTESAASEAMPSSTASGCNFSKIPEDVGYPGLIQDGFATSALESHDNGNEE